VQFKSYDQGREAFQGTEQDGIWLDEEPPEDVYTECLLRTMTNNGLVMLTFTPLRGMSSVVLAFLPGGAVPEKQDGSKPVPNTPQLRESANENSIILVADVDLLADGAAVDVQEVFGRRIVVPSNGNLAFAMGMVEQFAAGDDFISLRSRTGAFRPLTVVRELEAEAQKQYFGKIQALEEEVQKTTAKLQELQKSQGPAGKSAQLLSPEQQAELERFRKTVAEARLQLKEVRKNLRQDAESLVFWTKVANIVLMPLLVALIGLLVAFVGGRRRKAV